MAYTTEEINAAVERIVRTSLRRDYGALGNRRLDRTFSDLQDAAAGVFILFGNAPFYVVLLAAARLRKALETEQSLITSFIETVEATNRRVTVISSLSPLANASTALTNLAGASSSRTTDFSNIEDVPAFKRFENNTQRFLDESSSNVVDGGEVVQTPGEARAALAGLYDSLQEQHTDVVRRAGLLENAIDDFNQLSLAKTLSENIIANSRDVIDEALSELQGLTEKERLTIIRQVTLDILAARSAVRGFGSISGPTTFLLITGTGSVFADATHPATPAFIQGDILDPYPILLDSRDVDVTLDGDGVPPTTTIQVTGSYVALLEATLPEPFDIDSAAMPPTHEFLLQIDNYPTVGSTTDIPVTLVDDATKPIYDLVGEINAAIDAVSTSLPIIAEPYANPQKFEGLVDIAVPGTAEDADLTPVNSSIDFVALDIRVDDLIIVRDNTAADDESIWIVRAVASGLLEVDLVDGSTTAELSKNIIIGTEALALRIRTTDDTDVLPKPDYRLQALIDRMAIQTAVTTATPQTEDEQAAALAAIGLVPNMVFRSRQTPASAIVDSYNNSAQAAIDGTVRTQAEEVFVATHYSGRGRTDPFDFLRLIASKFQGVGDVTSSGTTATFTVSGAASAGALVGDLVVLRTHSLAAEVNSVGTITSVDDSTIVATMAITVTPETGVDIEVGPDLSAIGFDPTAFVTNSLSGNDGRYGITGVNPTIPIELELDTQLPFPSGPGLLPFTLTLEVGRFAVRFSTTDTTLSSAIEIDAISSASAAAKFFSTLPTSATGFTKYFQVPEFPKNLEEQDILERHVTAVASPDTTHDIVALEESNLLIEIDPELPTDTASITLTQNQPLPFARIRKKRLNTFLTLQTSLAGWLELDDNQAQYFTNLSRLLNPLAIDSNPTIVEVNDARLSLQSLSNTLSTLDGFLETYEADEVEQVDALLQAFIQKGADRATDLILEAQFTTFFGLDQDEVSYAGTVQKNIKDIQRMDLPIRKGGGIRSGYVEDTILAEYDEPDFEFDQSDIDTSPEPDFPIGQDVDFPERAY